jgi:para-nitrobenzyl esterase
MCIARLLPSFITIITLLLTSQIKAQYSCNDNRFLEEVFTNPVVTSNVTFGSSSPVTGGTQSLEMDIYQPEGDTMQARPLIVLAHGGSFMFGDKSSEDIVTLCRKYSKLGYVTASINYRLGFEGFFPNANTATETVYRATADMRAAIRYFRKDASSSNTYRIDTNNIFAAGVSAGAFIALHLAYLDEVSEIPSAVNPDDFGGIEGNSGNPGYSSKVKAIVNLCGAIGDTSWIQPGDAPCLSMHGTADNVVPYGSAVINVLGIPLFEVDGSASVAKRQENIGLDHQFVTWNNAPHTPFISTAAYMDSVFMFMTPFLANQLGCDVATSLKPQAIKTEISVYPNPANNLVIVQSEKTIKSVELLNISGKSLRISSSNNLNTSDFPSGIYILKIKTNESEIITKRLVISK